MTDSFSYPDHIFPPASITSLNILTIRDRLQMLGVYARPITAEMVNCPAVGDRPAQSLIDPTMGSNTTLATIQFDDAVTV